MTGKTHDDTIPALADPDEMTARAGVDRRAFVTRMVLC
jgi:hypothetical protein